MAISISRSSTNTKEDPKQRNVYDNYDNLKSVVIYDNDSKVDYVLKPQNNIGGKNLETKKYNQVHVDVIEEPTTEGITSTAVLLKARIYKNDNCKVHETGFIVWSGFSDQNIIGKQEYNNTVTPSVVLKGSFTKTITNLTPSTTYYYRAYVKHEYGANYSKVHQFETSASGAEFQISSDVDTGLVPLTVTLSALNAGGAVNSYSWNLTGGAIPMPGLSSQVITYTYNTAGSFTASVTANLVSGLTKTATKQIIATSEINPYATDWNNILSSTYSNKIVAAYDFRNLVGSSLADGLLAFWKLNGNFDDSSGNSNTLTDNNGVTFVTGVKGQGAKTAWGNSGSYLTTDLSINGDATLSVWFKYDSLPVSNPQGYSDRYPLIAQKYPYFGLATDSNYPRKLILTDLATWGVTTSSEVFTIGQWYHVIVTFDDGKARVYINGVQVLETPNGRTNGLTSGGRLLGFGGDNVDLATSYGTDTNFDSIGLWNRVLTQEEIQQLYNNGEGFESLDTIQAIKGPDLSLYGNTVLEKTGDQYFDDVSLLLSMDNINGFKDTSTNNFQLTSFGTPYIQKNVTKYGGAAFFDGNGDYLKIDDSESFGFEDKDFTIEAWIYPTALQNDLTTIVDFRNGGGQNGAALFIDTSTSKLFFYNGSANDGVTTDAAISLNTWTHVAAQRQGSDWSIYINGVKDAATYTNNSVLPTSRACFIGTACDNPGSYRNFTGFIEDFRITKGIARYTTNFTPPTQQLPKPSDPYSDSVSLLLHMDDVLGDFNDKSNNNLSITKYGNTIISNSIYKYGGGSVYFDGNGDYLRGSTSFNYSSNFTIEGWLYRTGTGSGSVNTVFEAGDIASGRGGIHLYVDSSGNFTLNNGLTFAGSGGSAPLNQWVHFAIVRNNNVNTLYINGTSVHTDSQTYPVQNNIFSIGGAPNYGFYFRGYVDDFRMTAGVARYTSNFTPSTTEFTTTTADANFSNVALLLNFNSALTDSSLKKSVLTLFGNTQINTNIKKFGAGAAYFDGNGDYIQVSSNNDLALGTDDFTVECWLYPTAWNTDDIVIGSPNSGSFQIGRNSNTNEFGIASSYVSWLMTTTVPPLSTWTHVAVTRSGDILQMFYNGTQVVSANDTTNFSSMSNFIGSYNQTGSHYNGFIDELRVTKGIARYTSNFVPQTTPYPNPTLTTPSGTQDSYPNNTTLLLNFNPPDTSTYKHTLTAYGNTQISSDIKKFGTGSVYFDGTEDYIVLNDSDAFNFNPGGYDSTTTPFTIEAWIYPTVVDSTLRFVITKDTYGSNFSWSIGYTNTSLVCYTHNINNNWNFTVNASVQANKWQHVALTHDGTTQRLFLNGQLLGSKVAKITNEPSKITIGCAAWNNPSSFMQGYIDDLRITKGVARYLQNFTPSTEPFTEDPGTPIGTRFIPAPAYADSDQTISVTFPHTVVFVGKTDSVTGNDVLYMAAQPVKYQQTSNTNVWIFSRTFQSIMPYNGNDNQETGYLPDGSEWFYIAFSFLNNNQVRYKVQTPTVNTQGLLPGNASKQNFNGYTMFGRAGGATDTQANINGIVRLGMFINEEFTSEAAMNTLFSNITAGPANGLLL